MRVCVFSNVREPFFYFVGNSESINHLCQVFLFFLFIFHDGGYMESLSEEWIGLSPGEKERMGEGMRKIH